MGNFYGSIKSANARKKVSCTDAKYPRRRKYFFKITWKSAAIKVKHCLLRLSNGKENPSLTLNWQWEKPKQVEIGWKKGVGYQLRATYSTQPHFIPIGDKVAGIDQGEVRTATVKMDKIPPSTVVD